MHLPARPCDISLVHFRHCLLGDWKFLIHDVWGKYKRNRLTEIAHCYFTYNTKIWLKKLYIPQQIITNGRRDKSGTYLGQQMSIAVTYRVIYILGATTDGCSLQPCLACLLLHGASNCRCSQTLAPFFSHCNTGNFVNTPCLVTKKISFASSSPEFTFSNTQEQNRSVLFGSGWCNACTTGILYGFSFSNFVVLCTDDTYYLQFPMINVLEIFGGHVLISRQYHLMFLLLEHDIEGWHFYSLRNLFLWMVP